MKMPPFVTAHAFSASRDGPRNAGFLRMVPTNTNVMHIEAAILKSFKIQNDPWHFVFCQITAQLSLKNYAVTPDFLFWFQQLLLRSAFPITNTKKHL